MRSRRVGALLLGLALASGCREQERAGTPDRASAPAVASTPVASTSVASTPVASSAGAPITAVAPAARAFEVLASATDVRVCPRGVIGPCRTIVPASFTVPRADAFDPPLRQAIPSDVRADGAELFLVRHEGRRGEAIYGEAYDVASGARTSRFPLVVDQHVNRVLYTGRRVLVIACVDDGPGCAGALVDPATGARRALDGNFYGVDPPALDVGGERWALVNAGGARVDVVDLSSEPRLLSRHDLSPHGGPEDPTTVRFEPPSAIVVRFGGAAARVPEQRVDLTRR